MRQIPKNLEEKTLADAKWLKLSEISYTDSQGKERRWETVSRRKCDGAVLVIPILNPSNRVVLIRQYRPPAERYIIEFPAGLTDPDEKPERTAIRELREETGYVGEISRELPNSHSSPGLTSETVKLYIANIDESLSENQNPKPEQEPGEDIEVHVVPMDQFSDFIQKAVENEDGIDAKVSAFLAALEMTGRQTKI